MTQPPLEYQYPKYIMDVNRPVDKSLAITTRKSELYKEKSDI